MRLIDADLLIRRCEKWLKPKAPDEDEMVSLADIAVSMLNTGSRLALKRLLEEEKAIHTFDKVIITNRDAVMCENVLLASEIIKGVELGKFRYGDRNFYESGDVFNAVCKRGDVWLVEDKEGGYTLVKESGLRKCREEK